MKIKKTVHQTNFFDVIENKRITANKSYTKLKTSHRISSHSATTLKNEGQMLKISRSYSKWANMFSFQISMFWHVIIRSNFYRSSMSWCNEKSVLDKINSFDHICGIQNGSKFHLYILSDLKNLSWNSFQLRRYIY